MRNLIVIALALFALGAVTCLAEAPAGKAAGRPQWEYQTLTRGKVVELGKNDLAAGLNKLGDDGWELVAVTAGQEPGQAAEYYFKRPKGQAPKDERRTAPAPEPAAEGVQVIRLKYAPASELSKTLRAVFDEPALAIVPDSRTNTVVVRGSVRQIEKVVFLVRDLDVEGEQKKDLPRP
jgi:type II secretory pathway component GspD/PulD (secretin)